MLEALGPLKPCPPDYVASNLPPAQRQEVRRLVESIIEGNWTCWPLRMPLYLGGSPHLYGQLKRDPNDRYDQSLDRERESLL